ncbi:MAG: hypothetical protein CVU73_07400 [Deltaproteobacteria bacterium HGW-Deltaproteobacteria-8]|jgi:hypothetical protein|nr:MAG: hypothetical protein CVU73_07400 [Deltaproteobacteria bacterium HGW-Deltaproteobacteria-8]
MRAQVMTTIRQFELLQGCLGRAACSQSPQDIPRSLHDPVMLLRGNPDHPEHDALGMRNPEVPAQAELIILGDSQVYGSCVSADQCWPRRLEAESGAVVYNAGVEGWGSVQYAVGLEELLSLAPRRVVVCLHTGNDIAEAFQCARASTSPLAKSFWNPDWAALPLADLSAKDRAERAVARLAAERPDLGPEEILAELGLRGEIDVNPCAIESSRFYLAEHFRHAVQDLSHPAIAAGLMITRKVLGHLRDLSLNYGFALGVMLIPTREFLVSTRLHEAEVRDRETLEQLGAAEATMLGELRLACADLDLPCFDLSGYLRHFVGSRIYPQNSRIGHPNAKGCELIARYVRDRVLPGLDSSHHIRAAVGGVYPMY